MPVYSNINFNEPHLSDNNTTGYFEFFHGDNDDEYFYFIYDKYDMQDSGIFGSSRLLIHKQDYAMDGHLVLYVTNNINKNSNSGIKKFQREGSIILLLPDDRDAFVEVYTIDDFKNGKIKIIGIVRKIITDLY